MKCMVRLDEGFILRSDIENYDTPQTATDDDKKQHILLKTVIPMIEKPETLIKASQIQSWNQWGIHLFLFLFFHILLFVCVCVCVCVYP